MKANMIFNSDITIEPVDEPIRYDIIDSHLHFLDFTQNSDGFPALVKAMDAAGVSKSVVFGMPMTKKWDCFMRGKPTYYLSNDSRCYYYSGTDYMLANELLAQPEEIQSRFMPFCCGVDGTDRYAAEQLQKLIRAYPGFWKGIGEIMSRHDDLTALTYGEGIHMDSPAFRDIYDFAASENLPVLVHHNISPQNAESPIYEDELIAALEHNRSCRIIWAHIGVSRRIEIEDLLIIAGRLMKENPNLYVDISWLVFDNYIRGDIFAPNHSEDMLDTWAALIEHYPDRFMIGSDKVGHFASYPKEITKYYPLLDRLKPETQIKLCRGNVQRIVNGGGSF